MNTNITKLPELLAPAGSMATALAAFDGGADAVYAGLDKFNARERGENFTIDSFGRLVDHAHKLKRKVYLTLNTLVKENEILPLAQYLTEVADIGPDALIVQDLGVLRLVREFFPSLEIHASTQMGIHNSSGMAIAKELGVSRVILERQVTMEELQEIRAKSDLELEVFVHGALCCSLSGQCLFSSMLGGYSGNRGKCKQACRRRFFSNSGNGFFFSTQDLCTIEMIPQLKRMNIDSLKIEGRLRQSDYVFNAVSAYRLILDAPPGEDSSSKIMGEARNLLSETCGRKWSGGFFTEKSMKELIQHDALGAAGTLCGKVEQIESNGFSFKTSRKIRLGDRIRIQPVSGDEGPALTVTKMFSNGMLAKKVTPGENCFICCDKEVPFRGWIFKIGSSFATSKLELPPRRKTIDLGIELYANMIKVNVLNTLKPLEFSKPLSLARAERHAVDVAKLDAEFRSIDSDIFTVGKIDCHINGEWFFPAAELKQIRREFFDLVKTSLTPDDLRNPSLEMIKKFKTAYFDQKMLSSIPSRPEVAAVKPHGNMPRNQNAICATSVWDFNKKTQEVILPEFCPENRLPHLKKAILSAYNAHIRRFRITSLFNLELLNDLKDIVITSSFPLPICNSLAVLELKKLNVNCAQADPELERSSIEALREKSQLPLELYRLGRIPLLVSRATIPADGEIRDARGNMFIVRNEHKSGLTYLYSKSILSIPRLEGMYDFYDLTNANWGNENTTTFNFNAELF